MINNVLKKYFGYDEFRPGQNDLINEILKGNDVLGIMPTGAGKSICFQVPAIMNEGITLVVSPLISLMQDQVKTLNSVGIRAAYINSSLSARQIEKVLLNAVNETYKIIYVAPERLLTNSFLEFVEKTNITMLTVDEAHCISQWGQDFRPSYAEIPEFIRKLKKRPVVSAFTATATERVKEDISQMLELKDPYVLVTGFNRENLYFEVINSSEKNYDLFKFLKDKEEKCGVIYCSTRKQVEEVCQILCKRGYSAAMYHAGMSQEERAENQRNFVYDKIKIIVATNAFGMGIDKPDVNFVIHYNMPKDIESYYQEAGRAGRDGAYAHCLMLYNGKDFMINKFLIDSREDDESIDIDPEVAARIKENSYKRLREMTFYSTTNNCLRNYILKYFGENPDMYCGNCSNCDTKFEIVDVSIESQKILSCVKRTGERFGKVMIIDVLTGSENKKVLQWGFDKLSVYGISKENSQRIRMIIDNLITLGYLNQTDQEYPTLALNLKSWDILSGKKKLEIKIPKEKEKKEKIPKAKAGRYMQIQDGKQGIFKELRKLRSRLAREQSVPAYMIFSDATLIDMSNKEPKTLVDLMEVSGIGQVKCDKYGKECIAAIKAYTEGL